MIKVAICEDSDIDRDMLGEIVGLLMNDRGIDYQVDLYRNGENLVSCYKNKPYDLIFLDIMMNEIDGIETGKLIRGMDGSVEIVYCTSSSDFAIAAYEVHAMGYLVKPYEPGRIGAVIDYFIQKHPQEEKNYIEVKSKRKSLIIPYKDIIHLESDNKVVYIYTTTQGAVKVYNKLDTLENELKDERFLRCHQSYLVNMQYVAGLVDSDFIMIDNRMIPIRKSGRKLIIKRYEDYLKDSVRN
ncbi:MAG: LytTR family DNA-binding domain-containing protein [Lachnospiraceae bacterium]|nr:LytTR family DNA-binding domain-containing protein [Lachnospiraceae bacterium]